MLALFIYSKTSRLASLVKRFAILFALNAILFSLSAIPGMANTEQESSNGHVGVIESMIMPGKLIKGHAKYEKKCASCHAYFSKTTQNKLCLDCHKKISEDLENKKGFHGLSKRVKNTECKHCHTDHIGSDADIVRLDKELFNHINTDFPLEKNHIKVQCDACHDNKTKYRDTKSKCIDCHKKNDPHYGHLGEKCSDCHKDTTWATNSYDHNKTKFPLKGKHQKLVCSSCHPSQRWKKTPVKCVACHKINEVHDNRFGDTCDNCHIPEDWKRSTHDHNKTKFPLKGKHEKVSCDKCHTQKISKEEKTEKTCIECHKNDDDHKGIYGTKCENCHTTKGWKKVTHDHNKTKFPLKGKHAKVSCDKCHNRPIGEKKLRMDCFACHQFGDAHRGKQDNECDRCHNQESWSTDVFFDHDLTNFPLIGQHAIVTCEECHLSNVYKGTKKDCVSCHKSQDKHEQTLGPKCASCHNPNSWKLWHFDHDTNSKFKLKGAHVGLSCRSCHQEPQKNELKLPTDCFSCHYQDDEHRGNFGSLCERCHETKSFKEINLIEWNSVSR